MSEGSERSDRPRSLRRSVVPLVLGVLALVIPVTVAAITLHNGSPLDHQRSVTKQDPSTTSRTAWGPVPGLTSTLVCARGEVSATLSVTVSGAPVQFHVRIDSGGVMDPGAATFDPGARTRSFSFTFVGRLGAFEGSDGHTFDLQWRSPSGSQVTLRRGALNLLFHVGSC
jgi:hypothetical protein